MNILNFLNLCLVLSLAQCENIFDVTKFGADPTGVNKSSEAIERAINSAHNISGGTVFFPNGQYLCGPIHLKSNVTIHLADNTIIKFSKDFKDYLPMVRMRWEGTEVINFSPLIYAFKQQNIVIKGKGILDGQGIYRLDSWKHLSAQYSKTKKRDNELQQIFLKNNNLSEISSETIDMSRINVAFLRPPFIQPFDSQNILIEDITVRNSPFWNINPVYCENVTIRGVKIRAPYSFPNTDGIDPDSSQNVYISNVDIDVGDDCIAIKSGRDLQGRRIGRPSKNIIISDSKMFRGVSGVAIGSEQSGGVSNATVKNCVFNGTDRGLYIKSTRGRGGVVRDIHYYNISMSRIKLGAVNIQMDYFGGSPEPQPFSEKTPVFRNIRFEDIRGDTRYSVQMSGLPESLLENIEMKNMDIISENGFSANFTTNLKVTRYSQKIPSIL